MTSSVLSFLDKESNIASEMALNNFLHSPVLPNSNVVLFIKNTKFRCKVNDFSRLKDKSLAYCNLIRKEINLSFTKVRFSRWQALKKAGKQFISDVVR